MVIGCQNIIGQSCKVPFSFFFTELTTTSAKLKWSDSNVAPLGWEIEIIKKGQPRTGQASFPLIQMKEFVFINLTASTAYEIYIRTICTTSNASNWNVVQFNTIIQIPSACQLNLPLKDNGTETFLLDIPERGILGKNVFLQSVDLVLEHDWPADMKVSLVSPSGQTLVLTNHNGTFGDDFGDISDPTCQKVTTFAPDACFDLRSGRPPYIGTFKPDGTLDNWNFDTLDGRYWKLVLLDRAVKDVGKLQSIQVHFNKQNCLVPSDFQITSTDFNATTIEWQSNMSCATLLIYQYLDGKAIDSLFVQCNTESYTFDNLLPNTEYSYSIISICSFESRSINSCFIRAKTTCETISQEEDFDQIPICEAGCSLKCDWNSRLWYNPREDNQDWIITSGITDTENTGPTGDINDGGHYIYVESNPELCGENNVAALLSQCMDIKSNASGCDMSFYYHMFGSDIGTLSLELSTDQGATWNKLFEVMGNQGNQWYRKTLSLNSFDGQQGIFRFKATTANGVFGDIALDQIEFYASTPALQLTTYYVDSDADGYGVDTSFILLCSTNSLVGYSTLKGDCNDKNPNIHPGATELPCNSLDENCNGFADDSPSFNPIKYSATVTNAACNGSKDGKINLEISGGAPPYNVTWNNMESGRQLDNIGVGVYVASITDVGGCKAVTSFFEIKANTTLNIFLSQIIQPSCLGKNDGKIWIEHNTDHPPYQYQWSNQSSQKNLEGITEGSYSVTVTDKNQCSSVIKNIVVTSKTVLQSSPITVKHPLCFGQNNGMIELSTSGGQGPYTYSWSNDANTSIINNLIADTYTCTVSDQNGCQYISTTVVQEASPIVTNVVSTENVRCFGENNGSIKTNTTGGRPPYTFLWNGNFISDDLFNLSAGSYVITVTDANVCQFVSNPIVISQPPPFNIEIDSVSPAACLFGKNGLVSVVASGGNGGYNYAWNHTDVSVASFDTLLTGNYSVTAFDQLGCKASISNIFIPYENKAVDIALELLVDTKCFQDTTGQIAAKIRNGSPPYDYNWSIGQQYFSDKSTDTLRGLSSGNYLITVTDQQGCTGLSNEITIVEKEKITYQVDNIQNNICVQDSLGSILISITSGTPPLTVLWNQGLFTGEMIDSLAVGNYEALIYDHKDCVFEIEPIYVGASNAITLDVETTNATDQNNDGKICVFPRGGEEPYKINWNKDMPDVFCIDSLSPGIYEVMVEDKAGCQIVAKITVDRISSAYDQTDHDVLIYPNPTIDYIQFMTDKKLTFLDIQSMDGRNNHILQYEKSPNGYTIDLSFLPAGMYILSLKIEEKDYFYKVLKLGF